MLSGYETQRARAIIEAYEPDVISVGSGRRDEWVDPEFHQRHLEFLGELSAYYGSNLETFEVSLIDPVKCREDISNQIQRFEDLNTVISPMNTQRDQQGVHLFLLKSISGSSIGGKLIRMKEVLSNKQHLVEDQRAADTLIDPLKRRYLEPFMDQTLTLQQAADKLGIPANSMLYQVKRLLSLGLLKVVRIEARSGRPSKLYRASAESFFVPFRNTSAETFEALLFSIETVSLRMMIKYQVQARQERVQEWGIKLTPAEKGGVRITLAPAPGETVEASFDDLPARIISLPVKLEPEQARVVRQKFEEFLELLGASESPEGKDFLFQLAYAPVVKE